MGIFKVYINTMSRAKERNMDNFYPMIAISYITLTKILTDNRTIYSGHLIIRIWLNSETWIIRT